MSWGQFSRPRIWLNSLSQIKILIVLTFLSLQTSNYAFGAILSGTFSGISMDFSTVPGVMINGSFSIGPQFGVTTISNGPGDLSYAPAPNSVSLTFTSSSLPTASFSNQTGDEEILLHVANDGSQSLILEFSDPNTGFKANLNLGSDTATLFGSIPPYTGATTIDGFTEYVAGGVDEGFSFTNITVNGPLTTPVPSSLVSAVPLPPSGFMMLGAVIILIVGASTVRQVRRSAAAPAGWRSAEV